LAGRLGWNQQTEFPWTFFRVHRIVITRDFGPGQGSLFQGGTFARKVMGHFGGLGIFEVSPSDPPNSGEDFIFRKIRGEITMAKRRITKGRKRYLLAKQLTSHIEGTLLKEAN